MPDSEKPAQKADEKADDAFTPEGRPTLAQVAAKAYKDASVQEAPSSKEEK